MPRTGLRKAEPLPCGATTKSALAAKADLLLAEASETAGRIREEQSRRIIRPLSPIERAALEYSDALIAYAEKVGEATVLSPAERELRRHGVSATDAAALVCEHPWRSVDDVFADKVCDPKPESEDIRQMLGHAAEGPLCRWLGKERGLELLSATTEKHRLYSWVLSTPDRDVVSGPRKARMAVAEAKLVGPRVAHHWIDEDGDPRLPDYVAIQVTWQMLQRGVPWAFVVAYLMGEPEPISFRLPYNDELGMGLLEVAGKFWTDNVLARRPPAPSAREANTEMLKRVYPKSRPGSLIAMPTEAIGHVLAYNRYRAAAKRFVELQEGEGNVLRDMIMDGEGFESRDWVATWKSVANGSPHWKDIALELGASAELIAKHTSPPHRQLNVRMTKLGAQDVKQGRLLVEAPKETADESAA